MRWTSLFSQLVKGKMTWSRQGPWFAAIEADGDGTKSYMATPTEELNFNLRGVKRKLLGSGFFSEPKTGQNHLIPKKRCEAAAVL